MKRISQIFAAVSILAIALAAAPIPLRVAEAANPPVSGTRTPNNFSDLRISATFSDYEVPAGDNRLLMVAVMIRADEWVSSVTYSGNSLTLAKVQDGGDSDDQRVELWYLVGPPVETAADLVVNFASYVNPSGVYAVDFTGVDQASPIGATAGANAASGTDATTQIITLNADSLIFGAVSARGYATYSFTDGAGIDNLWNSYTGTDNTDDDGLWGGEREELTAGEFTFNATLSNGNNWAIACLELKSWSPPSFSSITADKSAYKDGDTITLTVTLDNRNTGCTLTADFSDIDDQYVTGDEQPVTNWGTDGVDNNDDGHIDEPAEQGIYVITYVISTVNGITDGSHSVPVTAVDGAGNLATNSSTSLTLDNTAPSAPTNLSATALTGGSISLTWTASSSGGVAQYNIYRATESGEEDYTSSLASVSAGTTTYTDTSTTDGVTYYYVVRAQDSVGNVDTNTNEVSATADVSAPSAPTSLTAMAIAAGSIKLTWTASSSGDVDKYNIYRATISGGENYSSATYQVSSGIVTYTDTSTTNGVTYYYVVRAQDAVSNIETNTNEVSATASATGPSFSSITADKSSYKDGDTITLTVTLTNHNTGCTLTADFSNIDNQYVTGGESVVNWGTDGVDNNDDGHIDEPAEQGVYVISYLISLVNTKADGSHSVPVTATDGASNSATSSITLTLDNTAPSAPTSLTATAIAGGSIKLTWTASSSGDVDKYNIYRATISGGENYSSATYQVSSGIVTHTDTSTTDGVTYYYVVRAQDAAGNIETNTTEVSATASGTGPPAPTNLTATAIVGGSIKLTWIPSSPETNVAQYNIYRATESGQEDYTSSLASVLAGTATYTDTTTTDGVTYYYVVRAQDSIGNIETNTNEASATADATSPPAPTNLAATAIVGGSIKLTWTASFPETDVSQYNMYRAITSGGQDPNSPLASVSAGTTTYSDTSTTDGVTYYYVVRAQDAAGNIETNTNEVYATASVAGPSATVSQIYIKYGGEVLYDLASSTDSDNPTVFAKGKIDEIYLRLDLHSGFELNEVSSSITLFKGVGEGAEEVTGTQEINQGTGWAELIFHLDPVFNPDVDNHSRDDLYWVDASAVSTGGSTNDFDFYFIYDTTSPEVPDFGGSSFNSSAGRVSISGSTRADASDPQEVEIFLDGYSRGTVTAYATGDFSKDNIGLISGDNFITVQSTDRAGNKSPLSQSLRLEYNPQRLLSFVVRSSRVVLSGSVTIPVKVIYSVTEPAEVIIHIYNLHGEIVKEWSEWVSPGEEPEWSWSGDNMYGETINNGVYILKVSADDGGGRRENVTKLLGVLR